MSYPFWSRRRFLHVLGGAGIAATLPRIVHGVRAHSFAENSPPVSPPAFEEISPAASGIRWTHVAGLSPEMYMPETAGPGCAFFDYDNDGELDLIVCNRYPDTVVEKRLPDVKYSEPTLLFRNTGTKWMNVSAESGPVFAKNFAARGLALGDFDNDGSVDVLIAVNDGPPVLLRNNIGRQNHWLGVRLIGRKANVDAIDGGVNLTGITKAQLQSQIGVYRVPGANFVTLLPASTLVSATGGGANPSLISGNITPGIFASPIYLTGPRGVYDNISVSKSIHITERVRFQLQMEMLNAFNHPVFGNTTTPVGGNVRSTSFATTGTQNGTFASGFGRVVELRGNISW